MRYIKVYKNINIPPQIVTQKITELLSCNNHSKKYIIKELFKHKNFWHQNQQYLYHVNIESKNAKIYFFFFLFINNSWDIYVFKYFIFSEIN